MKKLLTVLVALCLGLVTKAEPTDLSQYDNLVYAQELTAQAGSTATLSIQMKNTVSITSWQFDMLLPDGVTYVTDGTDEKENEKIALSLERTTAAKHNIFEHAMQKDGYMRVLCASTTNKLFSGTEGEVATVEINIDKDLAPGDYYINIKGIVMSGVPVDGKQDVFRVSSIVTKLTVVSDAVYDKGYVVNISPLKLSDVGEGNSATGDIYFNVASDVTPGKTVEFDVEFSKECTDNYMIADVEKNSELGTRFYALSDPVDNEDGSWHFTLTAKQASKYFGKVASTKIGSFKIWQDGGGDDGNYALPAGTYPINVKNVTVTDADGNVYKPANTSTFVTVGTPTDAELSLGGLLTEEVCDGLNSLDGLKKLDLSDVVAIDGSLALKDCRDLVPPTVSAKAAEITYQRTVTNQWGTICVPFELTSSTTTQYYQLKSVSANSMLFTPVATVEAGVPAVFKTEDGSVSAQAADAVLKASSNWTPSTDATDWTMCGTYTAKTVDPSQDANSVYYITDNTFVFADMAFPVAAYRGYFITPKNNVNKSAAYAINAENKGTDGITYQENADGTVSVVYDLNGVRHSKVQKGINIINGKKVIVK